MKPETLALLQDPLTGHALEFAHETGADGRLERWLIARDIDRRYRIVDGIPIFAESDDLRGDNRKYQALYDRIARWYDVSEKIAGDLFWGGRDKVRRAILSGVEIAAGSRVLEVSVGTGINLKYFRGDAEYFGLDVSLGMLRRCQANLTRWKRVAELVQGNAEQLPFQDGVFDVVLHFGGINFFNDPHAAAAEMLRVARPGAPLWIGDETADLAKRAAKSPIPQVAEFYRGQETRIGDPLALVPDGAKYVRSDSIWRGKFYMLSFRKPEG